MGKLTHRARWWVVPVVVAMAAAGCSRSSNKGSSTSTSGSSTAASGDFGTLKDVCGPGNAKGATDQGVTDTSIRVGTMSDPGATAEPGLNQELFDAADAFVGWCNAAGGILGRKLQLDKWDARLTEVPARMIQACGVDFTLVGNGEGLDGTGVDQRTKCKLPEFPAFDVSAAAISAPMTVPAIPNPRDVSLANGALRMLKQFDQAATQHYGLLSSQFQSINDQGKKDRAAAEQLGYKTVYYDELPLSVDNWRPYAQNLQNKSVQVFMMESAPGMVAPAYKAMSDLGYFPKYAILQPNLYDPGFIQDASTALDKSQVYVDAYINPFELADQYPATKLYIDNLAKYANGAKPKELGVNATSSWLLWAQSVKACGSHLTRQCVLDQANKVTSWTGGGLSAPFHPGNGPDAGGQCFVLLRATSKGFSVDKKVTRPNNGIFNCDPANAPRLAGFPRT
jgi:ABC-type branched-subunit amino acid transport system substrate-binding protein